MALTNAHRQRRYRERHKAHLAESVRAHKLEAICMLDLGALENIEPPRGFGRD